jgi:sensor histidine kinase regulating citrate/malate metabolism
MKRTQGRKELQLPLLFWQVLLLLLLLLWSWYVRQEIEE